MRSFKRTLLKALAFVLSVLAGIAVISEPYFQSEVYHYQDAAVRGSLAGTLDTIVCGSSHAYRAIAPTTLDGELGVNSYNISASLMTMAGRYDLLKDEIARNPVELVILDASYNSLTRNRDSEGPEGDIYQLGRYRNPLKRASYFFRHIRLDEYGAVLYDALDRGYASWKSLLAGAGKVGSSDKYTTKGYSPGRYEPRATLSDWEYHSVQVFKKVDEECLYYMNKIMQLCKDNQIAVVVVVVPISQYETLRFDGLDDFYDYMKAYCEEWSVPLMDFNLLRGKTTIFPDSTHFFDDTHMSEGGAEVFSGYLCDVLKLWQSGQDYSDLFYGSYAEAEQFAISGQDIAS